MGTSKNVHVHVTKYIKMYMMILFCEFQRGPILHRVNTLNKVQPVTLETAERQLMVIETTSAE